MAQQLGTELKRSKYRLLGLIGQGQFGQVFCAVHRRTGRLVALKNLEHERFPTHKFLRELRFLLSLQHPNIVTCQALEHTSTGRYLVMDYCEGGTLRNLMVEENRLSLQHSLKIVADVLAGLDHAHSRGIVHCDIKPENILLHVHQGGWTARISDFGIARLSQEIIRQEGNTGSPAYMAPERFYGQYSATSDLYSVGILMFELIAGYRPFSGTPAQLMSAHLNAPLQQPATVPAIWQPFIAQALQKLSARRFRSAGEMLIALQTIASSVGLNLADDPPPAASFVTAQSSPPNALFSTVVAPPNCPFEPDRRLLNQPVTAIVAVPESDAATTSATSSDPTAALRIYQASGCLLQQDFTALPTEGMSLTEAGSTASIAMPEPIAQLLLRPQGCFVVMPHSVQLLASQLTASQLTARDKQFVAPQKPPQNPQLILEFEQDSLVTISPQGDWLAAFAPPTGLQNGILTLRRINRCPGRPSPDLRLNSITIPATHRLLGLLALDQRHLALVIRSFDLPSQRVEAGTMMQIITRQGRTISSLPLAVHLKQVVTTPTPYRLLATESDQPGTILLIDLKPHRIKRIWVEITPDFLIATDWGYILAETSGKIVFLDQDGRIVGMTDIGMTDISMTDSRAAITAMLPLAQGLLLATWTGEQGELCSLNLQTIGLDLVF